MGSLPGAPGSDRRESESRSESERRNTRTRILLCSFFIVLEVYRLSFFVFRLSFFVFRLSEELTQSSTEEAQRDTEEDLCSRVPGTVLLRISYV